MDLSSLFSPDLIRVPLRAASRQEAIRELVDALVRTSPLVDRDAIVHGIESRELSGSTGLGCRVAFPHARTDLTDRLHLALGISHQGLDWGAPDGELVHLIFLFVTPQKITKTYVHTLAAISALLHRTGVRDKLVGAADSNQVVRVVRDARVALNVSKSVKDIMVTRLITAELDQSVREAANLLAEFNVSGMPVVDSQGQLVGIISERDILGVAIPALKEFFGEVEFSATRDTLVDRLLSRERLTVRDIMSGDVVRAEEDDSITEVAQIMVNRNLRRVPVVREGRLVGLVGRADILRNVIRNVGLK